MTLTATEELDPAYKDAICAGELKQAFSFFAGGLSDFTMGSDFTMVSDFTPPPAQLAFQTAQTSLGIFCPVVAPEPV